ncbi:MAG: hypothetical protein H6581_04765 [Bacteroidia bacterium]|nr:hypothetical protein [Bacteroidia bacterium]
MSKEITLALTLEEVNAILSSLGNQPYAQVFNLISKIQQQAAPQVSGNGTLEQAHE